MKFLIVQICARRDNGTRRDPASTSRLTSAEVIGAANVGHDTVDD
jgi:hypothetical protein